MERSVIFIVGIVETTLNKIQKTTLCDFEIIELHLSCME